MGKSGKKDYALTMQAFLKKHSDTSAYHSIKAEWSRSGNTVTLNFTVQKRDSSKWHGDPAFTDDWAKNWGLWNHDVVEAFLQLRSDPSDVKAPYLEIQLSPLNQPFALIITEPRKTFFPPEKLTLKSESTTEGRVWKARMEIELPSPLQGKYLYGGCFSCLALNDGTREYYALNPNPEQTPDFHRPELFLDLDQQ